MEQDEAASDYFLSTVESTPDPGGVFGDGVCPSLATHESLYNAVKNRWVRASTQEATRSGDDPYHIRSFLERVDGVPPLRVSKLDGYYRRTPHHQVDQVKANFTVLGMMRLQTTDAPNCSQPMKDIEFNVSLGSSTWSTFAEANDEIELMTSSFHKSPCRLKHLRRWAEIVQASGQEVAVLHRANWSSEEEFWKMIKDESWQVHFTHENKFIILHS
ncbi:hypothetical protein LTR41_011255 [Exophiala xenobiotica]|nr:hypothetical protein LTR41_011255 [Exophiala xenobiotica]KAK5550917.1 hypothetical protein LTR46_011060 [Exophiala xenobiotica]